MKKTLLIGLLFMFLLSCDKNNQSESKSKSKLTTLNIGDATLIYQKTPISETRSSSGDSEYFKLDKQGNETKLVLFDETGNQTDTKITKILNLTDNHFLFKTDNYAAFLVDKQTEKIFQVPTDTEIGKDLESTLGGNYDLDILQDGEGNIYMQLYSRNIIKINIQDYTLEYGLDKNQTVDFFSVNNEGFIYYSDNNNTADGFVRKIKCPGGAIIIPEESLFLLNGKFYSHSDDDTSSAVVNGKINVHIANGDNELTTQVICEWNELFIFEHFNYKKNTAVCASFSAGFLVPEYYEFDGKNAPTKLIGDPWFSKNSNDKELKTKDYLYYYDDINGIIQINLTTYESKMIEITGFEIHDIRASLLSNELTFSGLEYSNGNNIMGVIHEDGKITTMMTLEEDEKIIDLIPIN